MVRRGQTGIEYMIVIGFVTFVVLVILSFAIFYSESVQDSIRLNQVESYATKVVAASETVFFAGEPSKTTIQLTLPEGVTNLTVLSDGILATVAVSSGENIRLFDSQVPLSGTLEKSAGIKIITITATDSGVVLS